MSKSKALTRSELIALLNEHEARFPDKGEYLMELRHFTLVYPPDTLQHDDNDKVVILAGIPGRY